MNKKPLSKSKRRQYKTEADWCKRVGLKNNKFNRLLAPVMADAWVKVKKKYKR